MSKESLDILLVGDNNHSTVGGDQESSKIIINGLNNKYKFGVIQPGRLKVHTKNVRYFELSKETRIKHLIRKPIYFFKYIYDMKKIINENNPHIIHTQSQVSFFIIALLKKVKFISKEIYLVHTERSLYIKYNKLIKQVFFFSMKELDFLVTTTRMNMTDWSKALVEQNILLNHKIIENAAGQTFELLEENKIKKNNNVINIGFAGRYHDVKNWPLAVEISLKLNNVLDKKVNIFMAVGCLDSASEKKTIEMFDKMNALLGDRFTGQINIDMEEMDDFYYKLDVFILTSRKNGESFGRTLIEAMSRYTAVLTTEAGGPEEVVDDKNNIMTEAEQFVNKVLSFNDDTDLLEIEKKKNLVKIKERFSLKNNLIKHEKMYDEILNGLTKN